MLSSQPPLPSLTPFQKQLQEAGNFFARLVLAPALHTELNQYGFSQPKRLASLFAECLNRPLEQLRFTLPPQSDKATIEIWQFGVSMGMQQTTLETDAATYEKLVELAPYTSDLRNVQEAPHDCIEHMFEDQPRSLINLPMRHQNELVAVMHLCENAPHAFDDNDILLAELVSKAMTGAFANFQQQNKLAFSQTRQRHLLVHYKGLHKVLQQTREAFDKADGNVTDLKQLAHTLKARAWENQERCATLERELLRVKKENKQMRKELGKAQDAAVPAAPASTSKHEPLHPTEQAASEEAGALLREIAAPAPTDRIDQPGEDDTSTEIMVEEALLNLAKYIEPPPPIPDLPDIVLPLSPEESIELSIQDLEIEEEITSLEGAQSLLYLSGTPLLPKLAFFEALQALQVRLTASQSAETLLEETKASSPTGIALLSLQQSAPRQAIYQGLRNQHAQADVPVFEVQCPKNKEAIIQLRWGQYQSSPLKDSIWGKWMGQVRNKRSEDDVILSVGFPDEKACAPLFHLFCGTQYTIRAYQNPVDGIQSLYQSPPQILALELGETVTPWVSLFQELATSARTREVPLLLFSPGPLEQELQDAIAPFMHITLTRLTKLI